MLETLFGATIVNAEGRTVPVRLVGEQHVREDLGFIPSFADWARLIAPETWMLRGNPLDEPSIMAAGNFGPAVKAFPSGLAGRTSSRSASPSELVRRPAGRDRGKGPKALSWVWLPPDRPGAIPALARTFP